MAVPARTLASAPMSADEFLTWSAGLEERRFELVDGRPVELDMPTYAHQKILKNLLVSIDRHIEASGLALEVLPTPNTRILPSIGERLRVRLPDLSVFETEPAPPSPERPVLLVEVGSPMTQAADATRKLWEYSRFDTLRDFLEIAQDGPAVIHWRRLGLNRMAGETHAGLDQTLRLEGLGLELRLADIYRNVVFPGPAEDAEASPPSD